MSLNYNNDHPDKIFWNIHSFFNPNISSLKGELKKEQEIVFHDYVYCYSYTALTLEGTQFSFYTADSGI